MKEINPSKKASNTSTKFHRDAREIVVCPWCYCVTPFVSESKIICRVCKNQITPEDIINYQQTKEKE